MKNLPSFTDMAIMITENALGGYYSYINRIDINMLGEDSSNLLHIAIGCQRFDIAVNLIARGINVNQQNEEGKTSLHYIAKSDPAEKQTLNIAKWILRKGGQINLKDRLGNNALWTAIVNAKGNFSLVKLFEKHGGDSLSKNNNDKSPLDFAQQTGNSKLIAILAS